MSMKDKGLGDAERVGAERRTLAARAADIGHIGKLVNPRYDRRARWHAECSCGYGASYQGTKRDAQGYLNSHFRSVLEGDAA